MVNNHPDYLYNSTFPADFQFSSVALRCAPVNNNKQKISPLHRHRHKHTEGEEERKCRGKGHAKTERPNTKTVLEKNQQ